MQRFQIWRYSGCKQEKEIGFFVYGISQQKIDRINDGGQDLKVQHCEKGGTIGWLVQPKRREQDAQQIKQPLA